MSKDMYVYSWQQVVKDAGICRILAVALNQNFAIQKARNNGLAVTVGRSNSPDIYRSTEFYEEAIAYSHPDRILARPITGAVWHFVVGGKLASN